MAKKKNERFSNLQQHLHEPYTSLQNPASDFLTGNVPACLRGGQVNCTSSLPLYINNPYFIDERHQPTRQFIMKTVAKQRNVWSQAWFHNDTSC